MIPFLDLKRQYQAIQSEIDAAVLSTLASGQYVLGPAVECFEEHFAHYCQTEHAVALNSGTSALQLALLSAGIQPGDEIITVAMTFVATAAAITYVGAKPVFVDIDPGTWTMDPEKISAAITTKTRAIVVVHLHGRMADMDPILAIAKAHHLTVIEDAAQAHGAIYKGKVAGSIGDIGCFSFYPGKNLGAYGEGGAMVTQHAELAKKARLMRDWGQEKKYWHVIPGFNFRMDHLQGAILNVKLRHLPKWLAARQSRARLYDYYCDKYDIPRPVTLAEHEHTYHVYAVRVTQRDTIQQQLLTRGIHTNIHYPIPVHLQPAYSFLNGRVGDLPETETLAKQMLSLPIFPELSDEEVATVGEALGGITQSLRQQQKAVDYAT